MIPADGGGGAPDFTIDGDPAALRALARTLDEAGDGFSDGASAVRAVDVSAWTGSAASAFRTSRTALAAAHGGAAADMSSAAGALRTYASALKAAQDNARAAGQQYAAAQSATQTAVTRHNDAVSRASTAPAGSVVVVPDFTDPGAAGRAAALASLDAARESVHTAASGAASTIRAAYFGAPFGPTLPAPTPPPISLNDGSNGGGLTPGLPTDSASLKKLLDMSRDSGLAPKYYADVLRQYYVALAAEHAGIDLAAWDPTLGAAPNAQTIENVYTYYGRLFLDHPELQWAGMANMIGPSFAGGFYDLDSLGDLADRLGGPLDEIPGPARQLLPPGLRDIGNLSSLSSGELRYYETTLLQMQKQIFVDQGSMHEAYLAGGLPALQEMQQAGLVDSPTMTGWQQIDAGARTGDQQLIADGNESLLYREQNKIIPDEYDAMRNHFPSGQAFTYALGAIGAPTIPGAQTGGEYSPAEIHADIPLNSGPITVAHADVDVTTPLPDFNISDREARWNMISDDTLPAYQQYIHDHPDEARALIGSDIHQRIEDQRLSNQVDDIAGRLTSNWRVHVGVGLGG